MKNLLCITLLSILFFASCDNSKNAQNSDQPENSISAATSQIESNPCTDSGYQIYEETAEMWELSWESLHTIRANQDSLPFSMQNLNTLKAAVPDSEGIRLYYCLMGNDTIPSLAMVNIIGCNDQYGNDGEFVLFSTQDGGQYFSHRDSLKKYSDRWKIYIDNFKPEIHSPVYAYNYSWEELSQTVIFAETTDILVTFGMRTLSADEYNEFHYEPATRSDLMGSIVYCNVIRGVNPNITKQEYFNFAKPCPVFCDPSF